MRAAPEGQERPRCCPQQEERGSHGAADSRRLGAPFAVRGTGERGSQRPTQPGQEGDPRVHGEHLPVVAVLMPTTGWVIMDESFNLQEERDGGRPHGALHVTGRAERLSISVQRPANSLSRWSLVALGSGTLVKSSAL